MAAAVHSPSPVSNGPAGAAAAAAEASRLRSPHPASSSAASANAASSLVSLSSFPTPQQQQQQQPALKLPSVDLLPPPSDDYLSHMYYNNARRISITDPSLHAYQPPSASSDQPSASSSSSHPAQQGQPSHDFPSDYNYNWASFARRMSVDKSGRERASSPGHQGPYDYLPPFGFGGPNQPGAPMNPGRGPPTSAGAGYGGPSDYYDYSLRRHSITQNYFSQQRLPSIDAGLPPSAPYRRKGSQDDGPPTIMEEGGYYGAWPQNTFQRRKNSGFSYDSKAGVLPPAGDRRDVPAAMQGYDDERRGSSGSGSYSSSTGGGGAYSVASPYTTAPSSNVSGEYDPRSQPPLPPTMMGHQARLSETFPAGRPPYAQQQPPAHRSPPSHPAADPSSSARPTSGESGDYGLRKSYPPVPPPTSSMAGPSRPTISTTGVVSSDNSQESPRAVTRPPPTMSWVKQNLSGGAPSWGSSSQRSSGPSTLEAPSSFKDLAPYARSPELRVSHKLAERKRRKEMTQLFDELKDLLPVERGAKSSKWEILSRAIVFVSNLKQYNEELLRDNNALRTHFGLGPGPKFGPSPSPDSTSIPTGVSPSEGSAPMQRMHSAGASGDRGTISPTTSSFQGSSTVGPEDMKPAHLPPPPNHPAHMHHPHHQHQSSAPPSSNGRPSTAGSAEGAPPHQTHQRADYRVDVMSDGGHHGHDQQQQRREDDDDDDDDAALDRDEHMEG